MFQHLRFEIIYKTIKFSFTQHGFFSTSISEKVSDIMAYYLEPIFLHYKISANTITLISLLMCVGASIITIAGYWDWGLALYALATLLDHIDGRVARSTNTATFFGYFFDGLIGLVNVILIRFAILWLIFDKEGFSPLFWVGTFCFLSVPYYVFMYDRYSAFARWIRAEKGAYVKPYIRRGPPVIQLASLVDEVERIALFASLFWFSKGMWVYFTVNIVLGLGFICYQFYAAYKNMNINLMQDQYSLQKS